MGFSTPFTAIGHYSDGSTKDITQSVSWLSHAPDIAEFIDTAELEGSTTGSLTIDASLDGVTSNILDIQFIDVAMTKLSLTPVRNKLAIGDTLQLKVTATFDNGDTIDATNIASWNIENEALISLSDSALVTGLKNGTLTISAYMGDIVSNDAYILVGSNNIVVWGNKGAVSGNTEIAEVHPLADVVSIHEGDEIIATIHVDGTVSAWGNSEYGGDISSVQSELTNVVKLYSNNWGAAALKGDGTVVSWGYFADGCGCTWLEHKDELVNIVEVVSRRGGFTALREDGKVIVWGRPGENSPAAGVQPFSKKAVKLFSNEWKVLVVFEDGTMAELGSWMNGNYSPLPTSLSYNDIETIVEIDPVIELGSFAAIMKDGSVTSWGDEDDGGNYSDLPGSDINNNIKKVFSDGRNYFALKQDGSLFAWGGTNSDNKNNINTNADNQIHSVTDFIPASTDNFSIVRSDNSVFMQGILYDSDPYFGAENFTDIKQVYNYPTNDLIIALKNDNTVIARGFDAADMDEVAHLLTDVIDLTLNERAIAALKADGSVVTWPSAKAGGDSTAVQAHLVNVTKVYHSTRLFAAITTQD